MRVVRFGDAECACCRELEYSDNKFVPFSLRGNASRKRASPAAILAVMADLLGKTARA
jgi:hypothetical protein